MTDLTKGSPAKQMLKFAMPVGLGNLFQLFYSLTDTRIVGSTLGEKSLAAVGASTSISVLLIGFLMGLTNGFSIPIAQEFGARNDEKVRKTIAGSLILGFLTALVISMLTVIFLTPILKILNVSDELFPQSYGYIRAILLGITATMFYNAFAGILRAIGNTVAPLIFLLIACGINIVLDLYFILKLNTGVVGAAWATVIAQGISVLFCVMYMWKKYPQYRLKREDFKLEFSLIKRLYASGMSMGMMMSLIYIGTLALQIAINTFGENIIVAHTAARKISELFMLPFGVMSVTVATYCGQNKGAKKYERIKIGTYQAVYISWVWVVLVIILSYTISPQLVYLVTGSSIPEIIDTAEKYLKFNTIFYFVPVVIVVLRNVMQGIGDLFTPLVSSSIELIGKVAVAFLLAPKLHYMGIIVAEPLVWIFMVIPLIVQIRKNKIFNYKKVDSE